MAALYGRHNSISPGSIPYHPGIAILEQSLVCTGREAGCNTKDPRQPAVCQEAGHVGVVVGTVTLTVNSEVSEGEAWGAGNELQVCRVGSKWWNEGTEAQI